MVKNHLKTIAAPKTWHVKRKSKVYTLRPNPGPHSLRNSISMNFLLIELLKIASIKKESVYILHNKEVLVDGKRRKNISFPVGLFDTISLKDIKKNYRIVMDNKGKFKVIDIEDKEILLKPYKITGKGLVKKKIQLNLFDGKTLLVDKGDYKVGDSIIIDSVKKEVKDHLKLEKGSVILLIGGKHIGGLGTIEDVVGNKIIYKIKSDEVHETLKKYAFVVGKDKPVIKIAE